MWNFISGVAAVVVAVVVTVAVTVAVTVFSITEEMVSVAVPYKVFVSTRVALYSNPNGELPPSK